MSGSVTAIAQWLAGAWPAVASIAAGLVLLWLILLAVLWVSAPNTFQLREALRLLPDLLRLLKRLAVDRSLPAGVRVRLVLLLVYLAFPLDLVPDVVPVIGYADDVIAIVLVLRSVVRAAGPQALERHWPGTADGLSIVRRLIGTAAEDGG